MYPAPLSSVKWDTFSNISTGENYEAQGQACSQRGEGSLRQTCRDHAQEEGREIEEEGEEKQDDQVLGLAAEDEQNTRIGLAHIFSTAFRFRISRWCFLASRSRYLSRHLVFNSTTHEIEVLRSYCDANEATVAQLASPLRHATFSHPAEV